MLLKHIYLVPTWLAYATLCSFNFNEMRPVMRIIIMNGRQMGIASMNLDHHVWRSCTG